MQPTPFTAPVRILVPGSATGRVLASNVPLSFWGGVEPATGTVIGQHHPLHSQVLAGRALVIPHGRGSCTGSAVMLELIHAGTAPALILLRRADDIIALGAIVAAEMLSRHVPIAVLDAATFERASNATTATLDAAGTLYLDAAGAAAVAVAPPATKRNPPPDELVLDALDRDMLAGKQGAAAQLAMRVITRLARLQGAHQLINVTRTHIDCCIYTGPAGLAFAEKLAAAGGQVAVPTTLNAISIDRRRWREQGVARALGEPAEQLVAAYECMGASPSYTCAPYLLDDPPRRGEAIAWAESNAVVFANSVLGARTNKTPDLLDTCIALTGRVPDTGYYRSAGRRAHVVVHLPEGMNAQADALFPLLGYVVGRLADSETCAITGLPPNLPQDALKAFGAAFATTGSAGLFHVVGSTPEAPDLVTALGGQAPAREIQVTRADLVAAWRELDGARGTAVDLVALGNPHFSAGEFATLAALCRGRQRQPQVQFIITTSRHVVDQVRASGALDVVRAFGADIVTDTCWCMITEPVIPPSARIILTNSAKYAHYGPGLVRRRIRFASLAACVDAAVTGQAFDDAADLARLGLAPPALAGTADRG